MKKQCLLSVVLAIMCGPVLAAQSSAEKKSEAGAVVRAVQANGSVAKSAAAEKAERYQLVYKIVKDWGPYVHAIYGEDIRGWADRLVPTFRQADTQKLHDAAMADTFTGVMNALTAQKAPSTTLLVGGIAPASLGDTAADLVFTPLPQCNLLDTRVVGGAFTATVPRYFKASGANFTAQGGSNTNCGIPANPAALLLGVTAVNATSKGWFKLWPYGGGQPSASTMSYGPTQNTRIDTVVRMAQGLSYDFTAMSNTSGTHLLVTVLGYYSAPEATALECTQEVGEAVSVANGATGSASVACPAGYTLTGGGFIGAAGMPVHNMFQFGNWFVQARNNSGSAQDLSAVAKCCRVPGR